MASSQISVALNKDEPDTPLTALMKTKGADKIREALGSYVDFLKSGQVWQSATTFALKGGFSSVFCVCCAEFTQGMILPTANGVAKPQTTSQSKAKVDRVQVGADDRLVSLGSSLSRLSSQQASPDLCFCLCLSRFHPRAARPLR